MTSTSTDHLKAIETVHSGRVPTEGGYCQIPTPLFMDKIDLNMPALPGVAFYEKAPAGFQQFRQADEPYSLLALSTRPSIWVRDEDFATIRAYAEKMIVDPRASNGALPLENRMETLRRSAINVMEDLFERPSKENIARSVRTVGSFVYVIMREPKAYTMLSKLSSHDPYTLQHSVGTAVHCIILAKKLGITNDSELLEVGLAGLLHDVGKVRVKREIINKQGPLDELEWEEMRQHSKEGYEIVKDNPQLSERTKRAILEHHEDKNGNGYPLGLKSDEVDLFSKIVCICDIFNALTTDRSYSKARTPYEAFALMREKMGHKIEDELFKNLVLIYGGQIDV